MSLFLVPRFAVFCGVSSLSWKIQVQYTTPWQLQAWRSYRFSRSATYEVHFGSSSSKAWKKEEPIAYVATFGLGADARFSTTNAVRKVQFGNSLAQVATVPRTGQIKIRQRETTHEEVLLRFDTLNGFYQTLSIPFHCDSFHTVRDKLPTPLRHAKARPLACFAGQDCCKHRSKEYIRSKLLSQTKFAGSYLCGQTDGQPTTHWPLC